MKKLILIPCCFISFLHGMETTNSEVLLKNDKNNVIIELDNVIIHHRYSWLDDEIYNFFSEKSFFLQDSYGVNYITPAYFPEFLKFMTYKFNISFLYYNNNGKTISKSLVKNMWAQVFGRNNPDDMQILSKEDTICGGKLDIRIAGKLHNTILISYDTTFLLKGQELNYLSAPSDSFYWYHSFINYHHDKDNYDQEIAQCLVNGWDAKKLLTFYKLLYIVGVLDIATQHEKGIVDGLHEIQFENDEPKFLKRQRDLQYYKRGYNVLFNITMQLHLLHAHPENHWSVLPQELRKEIVLNMIQLTQQKMLFPEIEKYFHGMEPINTASPSPNQEQEHHMQKPLWLPQEIIAHIAGYCQPAEKDVLMKLCKDFYACLHNKELILLANPLTVTLSHKIKKMFEYTRSGDAQKLSIWLSVLSAEDINEKEKPNLLAEKPNLLACETPLHIATQNNDTNSMRLLIKYGANVNTEGYNKSTCLHKASAYDHIEAMQLLLNHGADVNQTDNFEKTPLHRAIYFNSIEVTKLLLKINNIKINQGDYKGHTPLYIASEMGHIEVVKLLLAYKANIHAIITNDSPNNVRIRLQQGDTALGIARKEGHTQIVELLEAELLKETEK